jgi:hypothetical protein
MKTLCVICLALLMSAAGYAAPVLDQSQENATNWLGWTPTELLAQSFKPTLPYLTAVEAVPYPYGVMPNTNFTVEIWLADEGASANSDPRLGSLPLATKTITNVSTNDWIRWTFDTPVDVSACIGTSTPSVLMLFSTNVDPVIGQAMPIYRYGSIYPSGREFSYNLSSGTWASLQNGTDGYDLMFRTYGDTVPEPATMALVGLGGMFLARRRNK